MSGPPGAMGSTGDWEQLYATSEVSSLPWYTTALDVDIERALQEHDLRGRRILDLGTGPATQAMNLAKRGFDVLATDISPSAIKKAKASAKSAGLSIEFRVDNVLASKLAPNLVNAIVDRGVFHVLPEDKRPVYVRTVHRVLRPNGWLFLKCFSDKEPGTWGPHRIGAPWIFPRDLRGSIRCRDGLLRERQAAAQGVVRDIPAGRVGEAHAADSKSRTEAIDEVLIPHVGRDRLVDRCRRDFHDALRARRTGTARSLGDERDRIRFEMEAVLPRRLVDLRGISKESAVMEDLIEVTHEGSAVSEVHQFPFEFSDERLDLGDPTVPMTSDAVELPLRREPEAVFDQEEFVGSGAAFLHELVHARLGRVHEGRRRAVDQVSRGKQIGTAGGEGLPIEDPEDRSEDVVALHVRRPVERVEDHRESSPSDVLDLPHLFGGHLRYELRSAEGVDEQVVHPDVELELLFSIHIARRSRIPPDGELLPDAGRKACNCGQQAAEIAVDLPRVVRERGSLGPSRLST